MFPYFFVKNKIIKHEKVMNYGQSHSSLLFLVLFALTLSGYQHEMLK